MAGNPVARLAAVVSHKYNGRDSGPLSRRSAGPLTDFRYSRREPPAYRHLPGETPHPTRDPEGHSYGRPPAPAPDLNEADWRACGAYLHGVDLFNAGYWWESHEALESLWHAAVAGTPAAHVLQAVIQCAAAHLKTYTDHPVGACRLLEHAHDHAARVGERRLGIDLRALLTDTGAYVNGRTDRPARIDLDL